MRKTFTCIICPNGCEIEAATEGIRIVSIEGATCDRGQEYVEQELKNPPNTDLAASQKCAADGGVSAPAVIPERKPTTPERITEIAWERFTIAYRERYGVDPLRDKKNNSMMVRLVERLGRHAPAVACFYVRNVNDAYIVRNTHSLGLLLKGADTYHTQWATGRAMTSAQARQIDSTQTNANAAEQAKAMLRAQHERDNGGQK